MQHMQLYEILQLEKNATNEQIKKAYRKLAVKYHPDKCSDKDASEKFQKINYAYQILSNDETKKKYDMLNSHEKDNMFNIFKKIIFDKQNFQEILEQFINVFINDNNINLKTVISDIHNNKTVHIDKDMLSLETNINITLCELYTGEEIECSVNRLTRKPFCFKFPFNKTEILFENEGEYANNVYGDLKVFVLYEQHLNYQKTGFDLFTKIPISLYDFLYGGQIKLVLPNEKILIIKHKGFTKSSVIKLKNFGLPVNLNLSNEQHSDNISQSKSISVTNNSLMNNIYKLKRGTLYIIPEINNIHDTEFKENIKLLVECHS